MHIYNVTINIEESAHLKWLDWMKNRHIPAVLSTGKFLSAKFSRVLVEEDMGGCTYSVQYSVISKEVLEKFYEEDQERLANDEQSEFAGQFVSFKTELEVVDEYFVQRTAATHYIFTYGTLQDKDIQLSVFARPLIGFKDELEEYSIASTKVAGLYPTLEHTANKKDKTTGQVYTLTPQELAKADAYEGEAFKRIGVILASGKKAWTYIAR